MENVQKMVALSAKDYICKTKRKKAERLKEHRGKNTSWNLLKLGSITQILPISLIVPGKISWREEFLIST